MRQLIALLFAAALVALLVGCGDKPTTKKKKKKPKPVAVATDNGSETGGDDGGDDGGDAPGSPGSLFHVGRVVGEDVVVGKGPKIIEGEYYAVEFEMSVAGGKVFRRSSKGKPLKFEYKAGEILAGWERGMGPIKTIKKKKLEAMRMGGKRKLLIPGEWAYGHPDCGKKAPAGVRKTDTLMVIFTISKVDPMDDD